jgi:hypothetical protein
VTKIEIAAVLFKILSSGPTLPSSYPARLRLLIRACLIISCVGEGNIPKKAKQVFVRNKQCEVLVQTHPSQIEQYNSCTCGPLPQGKQTAFFGLGLASCFEI